MSAVAEVKWIGWHAKARAWRWVGGFAALALLVGLAGCELSPVDKKDSTVQPTPEPMDNYISHGGIDGGEATYVYDQGGHEVYNITVPQKTWSIWTQPERIYVLDGAGLYTFSVTGLVLDDDDRGYIAVEAVPQANTPNRVAGPVFWSESDGPALSKVTVIAVSDTLRARVVAEVRATGEAPDSMQVAVRSLGAGPGVEFYWANVVPNNLTYSYDPTAEALPAWMLLNREASGLELIVVVRAPEGFDADRLHLADTNGDGLADLVCAGLAAPGSPTRVYIYSNSDSNWHWIAEF